jgi:hypothetical protein
MGKGKISHATPRRAARLTSAVTTTNIKIMKHQIIPESAGNEPCQNPTLPECGRPVIEDRSAPEEIPMPPEMVANPAGCYPNCNSQNQNQTP